MVYDVRLADGATIIYSGKAQRRPDAETCRVKINDICADYMESLRMQEVDKVEGFISETIAVTFKIFNSIGSLVEEVTFVNDWSYDYDKEDDGVLSAQKRPKVAAFWIPDRRCVRDSRSQGAESFLHSGSLRWRPPV
jgi:hypothetical protein